MISMGVNFGGPETSPIKKLLLVVVPVPREVADSGGSVEFVIGVLHQANAIAAR
jgi:hypothetical protein